MGEADQDGLMLFGESGSIVEIDTPQIWVEHNHQKK